jgi:hypothetical protein
MTVRACLIAAALAVAVPCAAQTGNPADSAAAPAPVIQAPPTPPTPPDFPRGRISGYMFGDAYYNVTGDPNHVYSASGVDAGKVNVDGVGPITRDLSGFQLRRVYFQLDNDLSIKYSTRVRFEVDGKAFTSDGKIAANVKSAYLLAKSVIPRGDFSFGILGTPTWENSEEFWGYRSLEKTNADFRGIGASADLGVSLKGFVDGDHHLGYTAMIGNGAGQKPETDRFKKFYLALPMRYGDFRFEPYADYQSVRVNAPAVNNDQQTWKIFAGYEFRRVAVGVDAFTRVNHKAGVPNQEPRGYSLFARSALTATVSAVARFDQFEPDHRADNRVDSQLWIIGLDWQPYRDVHVLPNIEATQYEAQGTAVAPAHHDLQARVTFYYRFSKPQS